MLGDVHLEFLGRSPWWMAVALLVAGALLVYAVLIWRQNRAVVPAGGAGVSVRPGAPGLWRVPLPVVALLAGLGTLGGTLILAGIGGWEAMAPSPVVLLFLLAILGVAIFLFYRNVHSELTRWRRVVLFLLRFAGLTALVLLLFRPVLSIAQGTRAAKPLISVVVDASGSMGYSDAANQPNRFRQAAIAVQNTLLPRLVEMYRLQVFAYDGKHTDALANAAELDKILPDGEATDLGAALGVAGGDKGGAAPVATVLFSDGIHNGPVSVRAELNRPGGASGIVAGPVHTVRVGSSELEPSTVPDIAVVSIDGPQTAIVNNQVLLTASIKSTAMSDRTIRVILLEPAARDTPAVAEKTISEQRLVLHGGSGGAGAQSVQFKFTPEKIGRVVVRVQVPVDPGERSDVNNQQDFAMLVTDPKLAVLYVEGRVRPEVGPLRRALDQDPNITATTMVQTSAGRFEMTGLKAGDDLKGLPTTLAQWKRFKVIVLGDLDASFLNTQQQRDLEQAVRDGAGLLMIGGQNSFAPGGWDKTTLSTLLPVTLEKITPAQINTAFVPQLTSVGAAHPIFRNIAPYFLTPEGKKAGETTVPELSGCVALGGVASAKPGATVLAVHPTEKIGGGQAIVLAVQQFGKGRTAAFAADTTWRWSLFLRALQKDSPYNRFWGQMVRWLASQENLEKKAGGSVTAMLAKERFESGESVPLRAAVTDLQGQSTNFATVWAEITSPDGKSARVPLAAMIDPASASAGEGQTGLYQETYLPTMAGTHKVVFGGSKDNADLGHDESSFTVLAAAGERDVLAAEPQTLELISRATGGSSIDLAALDSLADRLLAMAPPPAAEAEVSIPLSRPRPFFMVFVGCLALEWLFRRRWQLQ